MTNLTFSDPRQVLEAYCAAVYAKDIEAFLALYSEDVQVFDMWEKWEYRGLSAWRGMVEDWFTSLGEERVRVELAEMTIGESGDLAYAHAVLTFRGLSAAGEPLRAMNNRLSCVFERRQGAWKIIHEHSSAPIDLETGKVNLQR